jgi:hypothetical protein
MVFNFLDNVFDKIRLMKISKSYFAKLKDKTYANWYFRKYISIAIKSEIPSSSAIEIKHNISWSGFPTKFTINDIVKIVKILDSNDDKFSGKLATNCCPHCGYGEDQYIIVEFNGNVMGLIRKWSGCLTYDETEVDLQIELAQGMVNLYNYVLTDWLREIFDRCQSISLKKD